LYASLIGFHPRRLKVPTGDELPRNGLRSMRCLLLLLLHQQLPTLLRVTLRTAQFTFSLAHYAAEYICFVPFSSTPIGVIFSKRRSLFSLFCSALYNISVGPSVRLSHDRIVIAASSWFFARQVRLEIQTESPRARASNQGRVGKSIEL